MRNEAHSGCLADFRMHYIAYRSLFFNSLEIF